MRMRMQLLARARIFKNKQNSDKKSMPRVYSIPTRHSGARCSIPARNAARVVFRRGMLRVPTRAGILYTITRAGILEYGAPEY